MILGYIKKWFLLTRNRQNVWRWTGCRRPWPSEFLRQISDLAMTFSPEESVEASPNLLLPSGISVINARVFPALWYTSLAVCCPLHPPPTSKQTSPPLGWVTQPNHWFATQWFEGPWLDHEPMGARYSAWSTEIFCRWGRATCGQLFWADVWVSAMDIPFNLAPGFRVNKKWLLLPTS